MDSVSVTRPVPEHPRGAPERLDANPIKVNALALFLADLCGRRWSDLTHDEHEQYRAALLVAAWLVDPASREILARHLAEAMTLGVSTWDDIEPLARIAATSRGLVGLRRLLAVAGGTLAVHEHDATLALMAYDKRVTPWLGGA